MEVREWYFTANFTLIGMILVDQWLLYQHVMKGRDIMARAKIFTKMTEPLNDNNFDKRGYREQNVMQIDQASQIQTSLCLILTGEKTNKLEKNRKQRSYKVWWKKNIVICAACRQNNIHIPI